MILINLYSTEVKKKIASSLTLFVTIAMRENPVFFVACKTKIIFTFQTALYSYKPAN